MKRRLMKTSRLLRLLLRLQLTDLATKVEEYNTLSTVETLTTEKSNFETKIGELEESISTLTTEREMMRFPS